MSDIIERAEAALARTTGGDWIDNGIENVTSTESSGPGNERYYGGKKLIAESLFEEGDRAWVAGSKKLVGELIDEVKRLRGEKEHVAAVSAAVGAAYPGGARMLAESLGIKVTIPMTVHAQVMEFHAAFGQETLTTPTVPSDAIVRLRGKLVAEEAFEFVLAMFDSVDLRRLHELVIDAVATDPVSVNLIEVADALADIDYVVEGSRLAFGIDGAPIAAEVHRSNMAKLGPDGKPIIRPDGKRLKPPGWTPPDIGGELRRQGWQGRIGSEMRRR